MSGKWKRKALLTAGIIILVLGLLIQGTARKNGKEKSTGGRIMEGLAEAAKGTGGLLSSAFFSGTGAGDTGR